MNHNLKRKINIFLIFTGVISGILGSSATLATETLATEKADSVLVKKSEHKMLLLKVGVILHEYHVVFGDQPKGHKQQEGDERTPEGKYVLDFKKPNSSFHKAIHISYPNAEDTKRAQANGVSPGGSIMIHGQKNGWGLFSLVLQNFNWTNGCIALSNKDMDELWEVIDTGTPIDIQP